MCCKKLLPCSLGCALMLLLAQPCWSATPFGHKTLRLGIGSNEYGGSYRNNTNNHPYIATVSTLYSRLHSLLLRSDNYVKVESLIETFWQMHLKN